ncbi:hypothetical protein G3A50_02310 [Ancylobacter pratisalsi]|uniref:Uncharacterized protein n=2 Tax=Ancylobacter pratisalsi TaxID=1745854 RepID=A0A6P1YWU0_9HYPH|nr:hypothetical protein G3A50_02310 [Ancylobacter pratisalsi]
MDFDATAAVIIGDVIADIRAGRDVDLRAALEDLDGAAEEAGDDQAREDYAIDFDCPPIFEAILGEARDLLRVGERKEAVRRLLLLINPKWPSEGACQAAYLGVMADQRARHESIAAFLGDFINTPLGATLLR